MTVKALLTEVVPLTHGSSATTGVVAGGTVVPVENLTEFASDGGRVDIAGVVYDYTGVDATGVDAEGAGGSLLLDAGSPLAVAVADFDPVQLMAGAAPWVDYYAVVDLVDDEDGEPVWVPLVTREERLAWPVGAYDPPLPVTVADDLSRIVAAPGVPQIDPSMVGSPMFQAYLASDGGRAGGLPIQNNSNAAVTDWTVDTAYDDVEFAFAPATGRLTLRIPGSYLSVVNVKWIANTSGKRELAMITTTLGMDMSEILIPERPDDAGTVVQTIPLLLNTTEPNTELRVRVYQDTGASLALDGSAGGQLTNWRVLRLR